MKFVDVQSTRYTVHGTVGQGGYSSVYRVSDPSQHFYALKMIQLKSAKESIIIAGFRREIALLKRLENEPRVIKYIGSEEIADTLYVVLELGDVDLDTIIHSSTKLELHAVHHYSREIFKCVKAIHRHGVVHSDLKPANFISVRGSLKLIDFGISDIPLENTVNIYRSHAIGTLSYMAPETFCEHTLSVKPGKHSVSASSDVWGCGCIIYEMIYRKKVFDSHADKLQAIVDPKVDIICPDEGYCFQVPWCFKSLIRQCTIRDAKSRISVDDALKSLALIESYATRDGIRCIMGRSFQFGIDNKGSIEEKLYGFLATQLDILD